ncbi:DNA-binding response regulator, OmpR family, contains REC and winged-helix (wHTH) domain [Seinonella peptonophila]|uniref:DNA-binding response regulator, OmpR family, contains REC and winged-helix (WHTH) domain n=1 Tax=Seinonella peptonophila TaxID=112248 RepID=A0A1M4Y589_9BACL|nr:response regulator transcription factor [Seinonella peptonophila]SHF00839.1 DNA-binding response regulator, OmpR family, contains REC and winged-helix (wHTH) domain [Seinonella peptonophila]
MRRVLIVDDEKKIREVIASYLQKEGYDVLEAQNGTDALNIAQNETIDLIILDLMLPDVSGEAICQTIRQQSAVPILMLTAKVAEKDRIKGLSIGADDYVIKPFSPREVVARVKAILRRSNHDLLSSRTSYHNGKLTIDMDQQLVYKDGKQVHLTPAEFRLLVVLARHPGRTYTREELIEKVYSFNYVGDDRIIDQHIKNLRQKIELNPKEPIFLTTIFGHGYSFLGRQDRK